MSTDRERAAVLSSRPNPGTPPARPEGMRDYVVLLKEREAISLPQRQGRSAIFEANVSRNQAFLVKLEHWLNENNMRSQLGGVGEAMGLEIITLTCTPAVAQAIKGFAEVEVVVPDSGQAMRGIR
jgi:hypothetical protein